MSSKPKAGKRKQKIEFPDPPPELVDQKTGKLFPLATVKELVQQWRDELNRLQTEKIQATIDRDAVANFSSITKKELREVELAVLEVDREREKRAEEHALEIRVYSQKVRHLEYEAKNTAKRLNADSAAEIEAERDGHRSRDMSLHESKMSLRAQLRAQEKANAEAISRLRGEHERRLRQRKNEFEHLLQNLRQRYEERLTTMKADLALRHKVEVHEMEERKNSHIAHLLADHDAAFLQIKDYYNRITKSNLDLITSLRTQISDAGSRAIANQKLMLEISEENRQLSEPLQHALAERAALVADLRDAKRDRASLAAARSRNQALQRKLKSVQRDIEALEQKYRDISKERDDLYLKFEATVRAIAEKCNVRADILEQRILEVEQVRNEAEMMLYQAIDAAELDPQVADAVRSRVEQVILARQTTIKELREGALMLQKATNDAIRVFVRKFEALRLPVPEILKAGEEEQDYIRAVTKAATLRAGTAVTDGNPPRGNLLPLSTITKNTVGTQPVGFVSK